MKKALLILVLLLIPLSLFRLLFGLALDEKSMKGVEERKQSQGVEGRDQQLISEFQAVATPESFNGPEVWVPPKPTSPELQAKVPQTSSQNKSSLVADPKKEIEQSTSVVARVPQPLTTGNRVVLTMTKDNVTLVQKALNKAGFYNGDYNGIFDENLLEILKDFQRYVDLEPDGIVDSAVIKYLDIYSSGCESAYALKISLSNN